MWSIVAFRDNSVEVVPSKWYDSGVCAWPKRNLRLCIDQQLSPNSNEFRYLNGRKLGKDTNDYNIAQEKANIAKTTSHLSNNESYDNSIQNSIKLKQKRKLCQPEVTKKSLWSPASSDIFDDSDTDPHYTIPKINKGTSLSPQTNSNTTQNMPLTWPNCNPKKKLDFDKYLKNSSQTNQTPDDDQTTTVIHTLSSPFKVTSIINNATNSTPQQSNDNTEILDKLNRNILNIKYDVKSLNEKIDKLEDLIMNIRSNSSVFTNEDDNTHDQDSFQYIINKNLPLEDEDSLQRFEDKLLNQGYRTQMVNELSRYVRNTIRSIMRYLFKDGLLQTYSYKGQKKKKIFSTLTTCSIIFDSVKKMKRYQKYDKIDVEQSIKIFIASAKFRKNKPCQEQSSDI